MGIAGIDVVEFLLRMGIVPGPGEVDPIRKTVKHLGNLDLFGVSDFPEPQLNRDLFTHIGRIKDEGFDLQLILGPLAGNLHPGNVDDPVAVDDHKFLKAVTGQGFEDIVEKFNENLSPDADGPGADQVVWTPAEPDRRADQNTAFTARFISQGLGQITVRSQRCTPAVLFRAADGDQTTVVPFEVGFNLVPGKFLEMDGRHRVIE